MAKTKPDTVIDPAEQAAAEQAAAEQAAAEQAAAEQAAAEQAAAEQAAAEQAAAEQAAAEQAAAEQAAAKLGADPSLEIRFGDTHEGFLATPGSMIVTVNAEPAIDELGPNPTLGEILEYEARKRAS